MSENHPDGFLKHRRSPIGYRDPAVRTADYLPVYDADWAPQRMREQGGRCMDCGVPTCTAGCPIGNLIPDWNDLVHRGRWREALERLQATNNFPEFTGYTCPAPCEPACVLATNDEAVTIKSLERAIVDMGWRQGWIVPKPPIARSGKAVAVVGSGPAGLACAQQLNRAGHRVTVFERDDVIGGLMAYGIPDFKFAKTQLARRVDLLAREGIEFRTGCEVGRDVPLASLRAGFDAVCLAIGAQTPRDFDVPGRRLAGVHEAMDYLRCENRRQAGRPVAQAIDAGGRDVIVLGGGDTGADCVATAHRQHAASVTQVAIDAPRPLARADDNPWPWWPKTQQSSYALDEGGQAEFNLHCAAFIDGDADGRVDEVRFERVRWQHDATGRRSGKTVIDDDVRLPAGLVLIATGFTGPRLDRLACAELVADAGGRLPSDDAMMTSLPGVFVAGDARRGASLVVWAIGEGRDCARAIDRYLSGDSALPASLRSAGRPLGG